MLREHELWIYVMTFKMMGNQTPELERLKSLSNLPWLYRVWSTNLQLCDVSCSLQRDFSPPGIVSQNGIYYVIHVIGLFQYILRTNRNVQLIAQTGNLNEKSWLLIIHFETLLSQSKYCFTLYINWAEKDRRSYTYPHRAN